MNATTLKLPETCTVDGRQLTAHIAKPFWLYVWLTHEDDGTSWWSVYRSPLVRDDDDIYRPVLELMAGAELISRETVQDPDMMFGEAELSLYTVAA